MNVKTRKSMRDDDGFKRKLKERHVKQSERKLMPGCTIMFYLAPPNGKMTAKYFGPVNQNGKDAKMVWRKSFGSIAMRKRMLI